MIRGNVVGVVFKLGFTRRFGGGPSTPAAGLGFAYGATEAGWEQNGGLDFLCN